MEEDHFLLTGETEPGCKLTVNGTEYPMNEDGSFLADLPLEKDENVFSVISTDPAGNQSAQNVTIYHGDVPAAAAIAAGQNGDGDGMGYLPMFFTMLIGMSVVLTVILTGVVLGKRRALIRGVMTVTTLRNVFLLVTGFLAAAAAFARLLAERARAAAESLAFIRAAQRSPQEAHLMLKDYENLNRIFFVLAAAAGICLASSILFMVLNRALKKRRNTPPGPEGSHRIKPKPRTGQRQPTAPKVTAKTEPKAAPAEPKTVKTGVPAPEPAKSAGAVAGAPAQSSSGSAEAAPPQSPSESVADSAAESTNAAPAAPPAVFCPHCGKMIKKSKAMFCPFCGKSLRS